MKKKIKMIFHSRSTLMLLGIFVLFLGGGFIYKMEDPPLISSHPGELEDCSYKAYEQQMKRILQDIREEKALLLEEKRRESEIMMKKQEKYCSQPFRLFLEKYGKSSLSQ